MPPIPSRRTMNTKLTLAALLTLGTVASLEAAPITGEIKFGSYAPVALTGGSGDFLTATGFDFSPIGSATFGINAIVNANPSGSFAVIGFPTFAIFKDFSFAPLPVGGADVWELTGGAFSFHLDTATVTRTANSIILTGTGVVSGVGYDDTEGTFAFSTQTDSPVKTKFSFSANNVVVPDSGFTMGFLGLALMGLGIASRRLS
jgi:hypothetical protein